MYTIFYILQTKCKICPTSCESEHQISNLQAHVGAEVRYKKPATLTAAITIASDFNNAKTVVVVQYDVYLYMLKPTIIARVSI